jgi:ABC-2 type transport system permease protein
MSRMLNAELLKLRTTRTFLALTASGIGLSLLVVVLSTTIPDSFTKSDLRGTFAGDFTPLFVLLLGAIGMAGEWRHKTITGTVLSAPERTKLLAAKAISYAIAGVILSLVVSVVIMAVGSLILSARDMPTLSFTELLDLLWRNLVIAAFLGALGVFVGALIRNPAGAIVVLLADLFIVENVLAGVAPSVWNYLPLGGVPSGVSGTGFDDNMDLLSPGIALLLMVGYIAVFYTASAVTFKSRDLT